MKVIKIKTLLLSLVIFSVFGLTNSYADNDNDSKQPCHTIYLTGENVSCNGLNDGHVELQIVGGSGNFEITWSNGEEDVYSITELTSGFYYVYVVDLDNGCSAFNIINITQPNTLTTIVSAENVKCFGEETGGVQVIIEGGTQPYEILWSNGSTELESSELPAGEYAVTVTDSNDCMSTNFIVVTQPAQALGSSYHVTEVLCHDDSNAAIDVSVWGGTPPYTYNWNNNQFSSQSLSNIPAGDYNLTIKDNMSCEYSHSISIINPSPLELEVNGTVNLCYGDTNGQVTLSVSGGTPEYSYKWANSDLMLSYNTAQIENLVSSTYFATVTDQNGCYLTGDFEVTEPEEIISNISGTDVTSFQGSDGQIELEVEGGVPPYSYNWSNDLTTQNNFNVEAGLYEVTITDANGCTAYNSIQISEPLEPLEFTYVKKNVKCHGSSNGEIFVYTTGGEQPYSFLWSTGSTLSYITELQAGAYIITITDANQTVISDTIYITQPEPIVISHTKIDPTCYGFSNGSIDLTVQGGVEPYKFAWYDSNFALAGFTKNLENISAGNYTVIVTDTLGCEASYSLSIGQPTQINLSMEEDDIQCAGESTGSITTSVSGGTQPYSYQWSNGETTASLSHLSYGDYNLTVSDSNGCLATLGASITEPEPISIELFPNQTSCEDQSDGWISSEVSGGSGGYDYLWSNSETHSTIYDLAPGEYDLTVTDIYGCVASYSAKIYPANVACLNIPTSFSPNGDGINDDWVIRNIHLYPDCFMQIFNQWGNILFESHGYSVNWDGTYNGNPLPAGTYYYILSFSESLETMKGTVTIVK